MKITQLRFFLLQFVGLILLFLTIIVSVSGQSTVSKGESGYEPSLQGLTEALLINGEPALRIQFQNNKTSSIKLEKRDGEDALVFDAFKIISSVGKLYVTKTKITYIPNDNPDKFFKIDKSRITQVKFKDHWRLNGALSNVNIEYEGDEKTFSIIFPSTGDKQILFSANKFLFRAFNDFDSAIEEFNNLTVSVRPKVEEEEIEEVETEAEVNDKYDRFKDITIINTSRMLVRGNKRSIRTQAEYNFAGKKQIKPEKVLLSFYASASRPLFKEDDLELNFLTDGKRIPLGNMRLADEEKTKTNIKQIVTISIPIETFSQIANSKKAEFQIGVLELMLRKKQKTGKKK